MRRAVFFDRDGVLNEAVIRDGRPYPPADAKSLTLTPGAEHCLNRLKQHGFLCICVTNQPDVARGTQTLENVTAMNEKVRRLLPLDDLLVCLHDNRDNCPCRKPKPGMLLMAAERWNIDPARSFMVGDRAGDMGAGYAAGCRTLFLDRGYAEAGPDPRLVTHACATLQEACEFILQCEETANATDF